MNTLHVAADAAWPVRAGAATILVLHIAGGAVAIVSGALALAVRKGGRHHALAGNVFLVSMLVMAAIGALVSPFLVIAQGNPKLFDSSAGFFTCYLVATGWLTMRRRPGTTGPAERTACGFAALLAAAILATGTIRGSPDYYVLGGIVALAAALDLRTILRGGVRGPARLARHLWRMCAALFVATGSFFLGQQRVMPEAWRGSPVLLVLGFAPLALMIFWLVRVRLGKRVPARAMAEEPAVAAS